MLRTLSRSRRSSRITTTILVRRNLATPSPPLGRPAEAFATRDNDDEPEFTYNSSNVSRSSDRSLPHMLSSARQPSYRPLPPFVEEKLVVLPPPLPDDLPMTENQSALYPATSLLDSLSLIHICLARKDTIPRAHSIFWTILEDHTAHRASLPDPNVWASVLEGILSLDAPKQAGGRPNTGKSSWAPKADALVAEWEKLNGGRTDPESSRPRPYGLGKGGEKIYAAYLRGLVSAGLSPAPILPYLHSKSLSLTALTTNWASQERDRAFQALKEAAKGEEDEDALKVVSVAIGMEQDRRQRLARGVPEEVNPIHAKEPYTTTLLKQISQSDFPDGPLPRFAIANLRATFKDIPSDELPLRRQELLEAASLSAARAELEHAAQTLEEQGLKDVADSQRLRSDKLQAWMWSWSKDLTARLVVEIDALEKKTNKAGANRHPVSAAQNADLLLYLRLMKPEKLALVTILEVMRSCGAGGIPDGLKTLRGLIQVGKAVETEYRATTIQNILGRESQNVLGTTDSAQDGERAVHRLWRKVGKEADQGMTASGAQAVEAVDNSAPVAAADRSQALNALRRVWTPDWTQTKHVAVGAFLMNALVDTAKVLRTMTDEDGVEHSEYQPAFSHSYEYVRGNKLGVIKLNPEVASRMAKDSIAVVVHPKHMPMLIPPRPWKAHDDGAYLFHKVSVMRFKESAEQGSYLRAASEAGRLDQVFAGLDVLSSTPWQVNRNVFDVVLQSWNKGEAIADLPASEENTEYEVPSKPSPDESDPAVRSLYVAKMRDVQTQMRKDHSERCKFNYNLELARSFLNDTFYIPHNLDFRGRAYPIPPHLNPVGDDLCRGLLTFGVKKPLGERGLMWLRIHLANLYGFDKAKFKDREQFSIDHEKEIFDSADNPLGGNRWWLKAEEPWQCLAACFELTAALRSENPHEFLSSLPVHQDGTCNGMQHYAALGGDVQGAKAVNLVGGDRPADVYTRIADLVNEIVNKDAAAGKAFAQIAQGKITRKVVKQTVMTTVYGVTFIGAKEQIAKQLVSKGEIPREYIYHVSGYIASTVLACIGDLFSGAKAIQDWLTTAARLICKSFPLERASETVKPLVKSTASSETAVMDKTGKPVSRMAKESMTSVVWTSPLGLPVVQPYRKTARKQVMTALQTVYISDPNAVSEVAAGKQASAMPPNFIHSLDATHMLLCSARCRDDDVVFASVHDSYWSHASSIDQLSKNIRETFIELHSRDIIGDVRKEFVERYKDHVIPVKVARDVYLANKRKAVRQSLRPETGIQTDVEADEEILDEHAAENEESTDSPAVKRRNTRATPFVNADGVDCDKVDIGIRQFVKFSDALPSTPLKGSFDVNNIRESPYFFS